MAIRGGDGAGGGFADLALRTTTGVVFGLIVIAADDMIASADRPVAWVARELDADVWKGPHSPAK